jgi:CRP-like cAMP-binding protein
VAVTADQLKQIPLFAGLDDKERGYIANSLRERTFKAGDTVTEEGQHGAAFFVIESGEATVSVGGNEVRKLGPGDSFGEIALIASSPRSATIVADTELRCHGLSPWDFKGIVEGNASIAWKLLQTLAERTVQTGQPA